MSRKVLLHMYMTLDGFAELPEYPELTPGTTDDFWEVMWTGHWDQVDTLLLGRKTFERWAGFWPDYVDDPNEHMRGFARFSTRVEKVVFSRSLESTTWANSRIVRGPAAEELARLRGVPGKNMVVGGGPRFVQSLLAEGLADELYLTVYPSIVGQGKPLFHLQPDPDHYDDIVPVGAPNRHDFRLLEARGLVSGSVFLHYDLTARPLSKTGPAARPVPRKRTRRT